MRIFMILDSTFPPDIRVAKEAQTLTGAGHEVHILCYRHNLKTSRRECVEGVEVHRVFLPHQVAKKIKGLMLYLPFYRWFWRSVVRRFCSKWQPHAIHVHDLPLASPVMSMNPDLPVTLDLHENYPDLLNHTIGSRFPTNLFFSLDAWKAFEKQAVEQADHLVVISTENRDRLRALTNNLPLVSIIPNTARIEEKYHIESDSRIEDQYSQQVISFVYVGMINAIRGFGGIVKGVYQCLQNNSNIKDEFHFVIVGDGPSLPSVRQKVRDLGLESYFTFTGFLPQKMANTHIYYANVGIMPLKRTEHTEMTDANKLYQYVLFGKPVLAAGTTTVERIVNELGCGVTYNPDEPEDFAEKLAYCIDHFDDLQDQGDRSRVQYEESYHWDVTTKPLVEFYNSI